MADYAVELIGWDLVADNWARAPELFEAELRTWAETVSAHLSDEIKAITPKQTGALQDGINPREIEVGPLGVSVLIGTPLDYAVPVELGSKPHDIYPKPGTRALHFIFRGVPVFARKVHHPGTEGYFMFKRALDANREQIQQSFTAMVHRVLASLAGTA